MVNPDCLAGTSGVINRVLHNSDKSSPDRGHPDRCGREIMMRWSEGPEIQPVGWAELYLQRSFAS